MESTVPWWDGFVYKSAELAMRTFPPYSHVGEKSSGAGLFSFQGRSRPGIKGKVLGPLRVRGPLPQLLRCRAGLARTIENESREPWPGIEHVVLKKHEYMHIISRERQTLDLSSLTPPWHDGKGHGDRRKHLYICISYNLTTPNSHRPAPLYADRPGVSQSKTVKNKPKGSPPSPTNA